MSIRQERTEHQMVAALMGRVVRGLRELSESELDAYEAEIRAARKQLNLPHLHEHYLPADTDTAPYTEEQDPDDY